MVNKFKLVFISTLIVFVPVFALAAIEGEKANFFVDPTYDLTQRKEISATLEKKGRMAYFYIDSQWFRSLTQTKQQEIRIALDSLDEEFYYQIYPEITQNFGSEWRPGIDKESRITVLFHPMPDGSGGYFRESDEYYLSQVPYSNEREMVYLNASYITSDLEKSFLAHEFTHLVTFNQKEKQHGVDEEVWLNEARAEYAPTLAGYDSGYEHTNLEMRVKMFLENPSDSITEWQGKGTDYGALSLFTHYLVDQYGVKILGDSLKSGSTGIKSINEALLKNGFKEDFAQIFTDWTIAVVVNDCSLGERYCYKSEELKNLRINPSINFLPLKGDSTLGVSESTKNWSGNWYKFIGSQGALKIKFIGNPENLFKIPYLTRDLSGKNYLDFFELDLYQRGEILIPNFGTDISSVIMIPSIQSKVSDFQNPELSFPFFWEASSVVIEEEKEDPPSCVLEKPIFEMNKSELIAKIAEIESLLLQLKIQLGLISVVQEISGQATSSISCHRIEANLYYGLRGDDRVVCLQEFLKSQGPEIYPEGLVTGNFFSMTQRAVVRFQEKYASDVLNPIGLNQGTGFVGTNTKKKINEMLALLDIFQ